MTLQTINSFDGGCSCRAVRYRMSSRPMIVHCCHCSWCQRESGSAFAINAVIERDRIELSGEVELIETPSASGKGQKIVRCPKCKVALWSHYPGGGPKTAFIRVGTLDEPSAMPPDVHIFTSTKQPWVVFPPGAKVFAEFYRGADNIWPPESLARRKALAENK